MNDLERRIKELEDENAKLKFDIHALKVAVATISYVVNEAIGKSKGFMAETIEDSLKYDPDLGHSQEYFNKLKGEVIQLLGKE